MYFSKKYCDFYNDDYSEIEGFDNLSNPKLSILIAQGKVSDIIGSKQSFFITQGATTAILASMKALIAPGDRVLVARNCHKSVFSGLILTAGLVDWFMPDFDEKWGFYTQINPQKLEKTLELNHYKVFIMTSPTYDGNYSDIETIANICKKHDTYLIVDEAHGSLYGYTNKLPKSAISQMADVSINSLHKTAGALNQCSILNVSSSIKNVEIEQFQKAITTSPSYPLLANIEATINHLFSQKGQYEITNLIEEIEKIKGELARFGVEFYESDFHDPTKIVLRKHGISGYDLSEILFKSFDIEDEMSAQNYCLFLTGIGTTKAKLDKLKNALSKIRTNPSHNFGNISQQPFPMTKIQPVSTFNRNYTYINKQNAQNKISYNLICPYPPGIGILYPGELIQEWHLDYLNNDVEVII